MVARKIEKPLREMLQKFPILAVTGPRQSGKTTLLRAAFPSYRYVNLEQANLRDFFTDDPEGFLRMYDRKVIFDEAQRLPDLFSWLQVKADESGEMGQFILSGSQNFLLMEKISQSLAGRVALFRLLPFSHEELLGAVPSKLPDEAEQAIFTGGYPVLYDRGLEPGAYFSGYVETYLERDVRNLTNVSDLNAFRTFLRLCAGRVGQTVKFQALASEAGISTPTAKKWLSILEASYILFQLPPYFENFNQRVVKSAKFYFYDTGLLCFLLNLNHPDQLQTFHARGSLFENMVIAELLKNRNNRFQPTAFYFWQNSNAVEVDLVIQEGGQTHLIEIKYSYTARSDFFKGLQTFRKAVPHLNGQNRVVFAGNETQPRTFATLHSWRDLSIL
jgi:uncharacterized protein